MCHKPRIVGCLGVLVDQKLFGRKAFNLQTSILLGNADLDLVSGRRCAHLIERRVFFMLKDFDVILADEIDISLIAHVGVFKHLVPIFVFPPDLDQAIAKRKPLGNAVVKHPVAFALAPELCVDVIAGLLCAFLILRRKGQHFTQVVRRRECAHKAWENPADSIRYVSRDNA